MSEIHEEKEMRFNKVLSDGTRVDFIFPCTVAPGFKALLREGASVCG